MYLSPGLQKGKTKKYFSTCVVSSIMNSQIMLIKFLLLYFSVIKLNFPCNIKKKYSKTRLFLQTFIIWSFSDGYKNIWHVKLKMVLILSRRKSIVLWSWWWNFQYTHWLLGPRQFSLCEFQKQLINVINAIWCYLCCLWMKADLKFDRSEIPWDSYRKTRNQYK